MSIFLLIARINCLNDAWPTQEWRLIPWSQCFYECKRLILSFKVEEACFISHWISYHALASTKERSSVGAFAFDVVILMDTETVKLFRAELANCAKEINLSRLRSKGRWCARPRNDYFSHFNLAETSELAVGFQKSSWTDSLLSKYQLSNTHNFFLLFITHDQSVIGSCLGAG